jgi:hypothetical protein
MNGEENYRVNDQNKRKNKIQPSNSTQKYSENHPISQASTSKPSLKGTKNTIKYMTPHYVLKYL